MKYPQQFVPGMWYCNAEWDCPQAQDNNDGTFTLRDGDRLLEAITVSAADLFVHAQAVKDGAGVPESCALQATSNSDGTTTLADVVTGRTFWTPTAKYGPFMVAFLAGKLSAEPIAA